MGTASRLWAGRELAQRNNDFMRAGESQLSSFELFYDEPAMARFIIATPWRSKLVRPKRKLFAKWTIQIVPRMANASAPMSRIRPIVWERVITLDQKRALAIVTIKERLSTRL
jgi:hypothetical protein